MQKGTRYWILIPIFLGMATLVHPVPFTPQEKRGKEIYQNGTSARGEVPLEAVIQPGDNVVPASVLPCINCHGEDGGGRAEGGITPSNIRWSNLTKSYGATHAYGRKTPAYTERTLKRAISMGIDSAGRDLSIVMPRYRMSLLDMEDLLAYMKQLGKVSDPGLTSRLIRIGIVSARDETLVGTKTLLETFFLRLNQQGGINGRKLEARFIDADLARQPAYFKKFLLDQEIFAVIVNTTDGIDISTADVCETLQVPTIATFSLSGHEPDIPQRYVFHLYAGLLEQSAALVKFARDGLTLDAKNPLLVYLNEVPWNAAVHTVRGLLDQAGWQDPLTIELAAITDTETFPPEVQNADLVMLLVPEISPLLVSRISQHTRASAVLALGFTAARLVDTAAMENGRIYLSMPTAVSTRTESVLLELAALQQLVGSSDEGQAGQVDAYASGLLLAEALKRSGRKLSRENLIKVLEGLHRFHTGITPPLSFGPNRRIGARGSYILEFDGASRRLHLVSDWIEVP